MTTGRRPAPRPSVSPPRLGWFVSAVLVAVRRSFGSRGVFSVTGSMGSDNGTRASSPARLGRRLPQPDAAQARPPRTRTAESAVLQWASPQAGGAPPDTFGTARWDALTRSVSTVGSAGIGSRRRWPERDAVGMVDSSPSSSPSRASRRWAGGGVSASPSAAASPAVEPPVLVGGGAVDGAGVQADGGHARRPAVAEDVGSNLGPRPRLALAESLIGGPPGVL